METAQAPLEPRGTFAERRQNPRQILIVKGMLYRDNGLMAPQRVQVKNVSAKGVAFESKSPIEVGTRCLLRVEMGPTKLAWRVQVVCCGKIEKGGYYVGGQFVTNELEPAGPADHDPSQTEPLYILE